MSLENIISPNCKRLETILYPNGLLEMPGFIFNFSYDSYSINIEMCGVERIVIESDTEVDANSLWRVFQLIHLAQAFGAGYFYRVEKLSLLNSINASIYELETYAKYCINEMVTFYKPAGDFRNGNLKIFDTQEFGELFSDDVFNKFDAIYNDLLILIHGFWLQSADTNMPVDIRCAGIIQCYEHFGRYVAKKTDKVEELKELKTEKGSDLSNHIKFLLKNYPLPALFDNAKDTFSMDSFTKKASNSRGRIMHFDIDMKIEQFSTISNV